MTFSNVPWENFDWNKERELLNINIQKLVSMPKNLQYDSFKEIAAVISVMLANKLEKTIPDGISERLNPLDTYKLLSGCLEKHDYNDPPQCNWSAEGGVNETEAHAQLTQHMRAFIYLCRSHNGTCQPQLTLDIIKKTHGILMNGAMDRHDIMAGTFRPDESHSASGFQYIYHLEIESKLVETLQLFENEMQNPAFDKISVAAKLFYKILIIHPFRNGNGRLCRLLANYVILRAGFPFATTLSSCHKKARGHYQTALKYADNHNQDTSKLATILLFSIIAKVKNYFILIDEIY